MKQDPLFSLGDRVTLSGTEQYCDSTLLRNRAGVTTDLGATGCHPRNCRHSCQSNTNFRTLDHFPDRVPMHEKHNEGAPRVVNRVQVSSQRRGAAHSTVNCSGHVHDHCAESNVKMVEENRCCNRGSSLSDIHVAHGHSFTGSEYGCCCGNRPNGYSGRDDDTIVDRMRVTGRNSFFPVSEDFSQRATTDGCMSHLPSISRKAALKGSVIDAQPVSNSLLSAQASKEQVIFYGWFLMKPTSSNCNPACSTLPQVAIGGYKSAGMQESDYRESGPIVQRLDRWRLRTSDGVEVGLMGMINVAKSVANGFSQSLAQCFMIGFPSAWIYMMLHFNAESRKAGTPELPSSSHSPGPASRQPDDNKDDETGCPHALDIPLPETTPVQAVLSSPLFVYPEEARMKTLHRPSPAGDVLLQTVVVSDANSVPQSGRSQDRVDLVRNDSDSCYGAINSGNHSPHSELKLPGSSGCQIPCDLDGFKECPSTDDKGLQAKGSVSSLKEEMSREGYISLCNLSTARSEQCVVNTDRESLLVEAMSRTQENERRAEKCDVLSPSPENTIPGAVLAEIAKGCTCASVSDSKAICPSCCVKVDENRTSLGGGPNGDRESMGDANIKDNSNEDTSNREGDIGKPSAEQSTDCSDTTRKRYNGDADIEDNANENTSTREGDLGKPSAGESPHCSDTTRKRPFQELTEDVLDRRSKVLCGSHVPSRVRTRSTAGKVRNEAPSNPTAAGGVTGMMQDSMPCTPLQESRKRARSPPESPESPIRNGGNRDKSTDEPMVDASFLKVGGETNLVPKKSLAAEPKTRKRLKKSESIALPRGQLGAVSEELPDHVVDTEGDLNGDSGREFNVSASKYESGAVNVNKGRRMVALISSSNQSGEDLGACCLSKVGRELNGPLKCEEHVEMVCPTAEDVSEAEHNCEEGGVNVAFISRKYRRKSRSYYKGRRRKFTKKGCVAEKEIVDLNTKAGFFSGDGEEVEHNNVKDEKDLNDVTDASCSDDDKNRSFEPSRGDIPVPPQQRRQRRTSRNYFRSRRRKVSTINKEIGKDSQGKSLAEDSTDNVSHKESEYSEKSDSAVRLSKTVRRRRLPKSGKKTLLDRCAPPKVTKRGARKDGECRKKANKPKTSIVPPAPPSPRVIDKTMVPEAFGLKTSRHGRVLVPRLATWRNQSIKYDIDGSIIAIAEGFKGVDAESGTGCYNFKPPADKDARTMQRKLCKAAEVTRS